jgi:hypothetical protein
LTTGNNPRDNEILELSISGRQKNKLNLSGGYNLNLDNIFV